MKNWLFFILVLLLHNVARAQTYLGVFETGSQVPFMVVASDAQTGAPTNPVNLQYNVYKSGVNIASGTLSTVTLGVASGVYSATSSTPGNYQILISGWIGGVTAQTYQTFTVVSSGHGQSSIAQEVSGLNGITPLSAPTYQPFHTELLSKIASSAEAVTEEVQANVLDFSEVLNETKIATRELSRSRLWYAQSTIDSVTRKVPADLPSHLEVQLSAPDDLAFTAPLETFFRVYYYPDALNSTKASREVRSVTPPLDGSFYLQPNIGW